MSEHPQIRIAVVMERRSLNNRWQSETWLPVALRAAAKDDGSTGPQRLEEGEDSGTTRWLHPSLLLELHPVECEGYWQNLVSPDPRIFVLWRMEDDLAVPERITASYDEASAWMDASESVEGVTMPDELALWVGDYLKANFRPEQKRRIRPQSFKHPKDRAQS